MIGRAVGRSDDQAVGRLGKRLSTRAHVQAPLASKPKHFGAALAPPPRPGRELLRQWANARSADGRAELLPDGSLA